MKKMLRNAPDTFGAFYDPKFKTRQIHKLEKMEKDAQSQTGSNSASFFLYRRAKFLEQDRMELLKQEEEERKKQLENEQIRECNKAEVEKKLKKNQLKRQKKKERKETYEKRQKGLLPQPVKKKIVRDESAIRAVSEAVSKMNEKELEMNPEVTHIHTIGESERDPSEMTPSLKEEPSEVIASTKENSPTSPEDKITSKSVHYSVYLQTTQREHSLYNKRTKTSSYSVGNKGICKVPLFSL